VFCQIYGGPGDDLLRKPCILIQKQDTTHHMRACSISNSKARLSMCICSLPRYLFIQMFKTENMCCMLCAVVFVFNILGRKALCGGTCVFQKFRHTDRICLCLLLWFLPCYLNISQSRACFVWSFPVRFKCCQKGLPGSTNVLVLSTVLYTSKEKRERTPYVLSCVAI
jgi:hypothetical protein